MSRGDSENRSTPSNSALPPVGSISRSRRAAGRGLAGTGFADQADDRAALDVEADILDRMHDAAVAGRKMLGQALHAEQRRAHSSALRCSATRHAGRPAPAAGGAARQGSMAKAQRGAKAQPGGRLVIGGTVPGIGYSAWRSPAASMSRAAFGDAGEQAPRVGVARPREEVVDRRLFDDAAGIHHDDIVGDLGDDAEIVGDEQDRSCPISGCSRRIRSRICAWMVTSSAVVGSSAISSDGLQDSAMAIITRWRMPPDIWCG